MDLYLLRHAIAVERGTPGFEDDRARPLTPEGRRKMRRVARWMQRRGLELDQVVSSPLVRARATAEILVEELGAPRRIRFTDHLEPGADPKALIGWLSRLRGRRGAVLLVGHEPDLSGLAGLLLGAGVRAGLSFRKAGLCKLRVEHLAPGRCAELEWWVTPALMIGRHG